MTKKKSPFRKAFTKAKKRIRSKKARKRTTIKGRKAVKGISTILYGSSTTRSKTRKKKGRPRGPSGKYLIPGKGYVSVEVYRAYLTKLRKLAKLRQMGYQIQANATQSKVVQQDNILHAPNFMRGELKDVRDRGVLVKNVDDLQKPITNPYGDTYLEVEIGSGKAIVKKRISERWATGESK
jgi:hypothetical protein